MPGKNTTVKKESNSVEKKVVEKKPVEKKVAEKKVAEKKTSDKKQIIKKTAKKSALKKADKKKKKAVKNDDKKKDRSFKVIYTDPNGDVIMEGRYCGAKPKQAACKALTGIYKIFKESGKNLKNDEIKFGVYETTRGSRNKKYWYTGKKKELANPIKLYQMPMSADGNLTEESNKLLKKWEISREKNMSPEEKEKLELKKKNKKEGGKRYCSYETISEMGGFKKVFGENDIKPAIVYNFTNEINKASKDECAHLLNVKKIVEEGSDNESEVEQNVKSKKESKAPPKKESKKESKEESKKESKESSKEKTKKK
jgi:hypothetical protein